jgi:hypothetical protein
MYSSKYSRKISRIDVSVAAVEYRAFVVAAPPFFVAGNPPAKYRGAVSVGAVSPARGDANRILTAASRGCPELFFPGSRTIRQAAEE